MKLRNKFLVILLAVVFVFSMFAMAACDDGDPKTTEVSITLSKPSVSLVVGGEKATINATVKGTKDKPQWSVADDTVATIQYQGNTCEITAVTAGTTTVTAKVGKKTATCTVEVEPASKPAITIALDKDELSLTKGDEATEVTAVLTNADDGDTVTWLLASGGDAVVTITPNGNKVSVLPIAVGTTKLTAKIGDVTETIDITVTKAPVSLTLDKEKVELEYDPDAETAATATVTATVENTEEKVEWTINSDIATITQSDDGLTCTVTAAGVGRATLKAAVDGETATIPVIISPAEGAEISGELTISIEEEYVLIEKGKTLDITATVKGSIVEPTWSLAAEEGTVAEDVAVLSKTTGEEVTITAVGAGAVLLTVSIGDGETEKVELGILVAALSVDRTEIVLVNDETDDNYSAVITATVEPVIAEVGWDVPGGEEAVVTVVEDKANHKLTVTANKVGTTTIYATLGDIKREITVTVKEPITVTASQDSLTFKKGGDAKTVLVTVTGTDEEIELGISDEDVVTVTKSYVDGHYELTITPGEVGHSTVYANVGGKFAAIYVLVEGIPQISFTGTDKFGYENGDIVWHKALFEANPDITTSTTVEATATVNGVAVPESAIEVNLPAAIEVHVKVPGTIYDDVVINYTFKNGDEVVATAKLNYTGVKEVVLDSTMLSIAEGENDTVAITSVNGSDNLDGKTISWAIADTTIATIPEDSNGASVVVTAVAEGETTLTCTVDGIENTCKIKVTKDAGGPTEAKDCTDLIIKTAVKNTAEYQIYFNFESVKTNEEYQDIIDAIDLSKTVVEVTITGEEQPVTYGFHQKYWQAANVYNLYLNVNGNGSFDWDNKDYMFRFSLKNGKGEEVAYGTTTEAAPADIMLPQTVDIKLGENDAEVDFEVEVIGLGALKDALANVTWTLTGGEGYATIPANSTGSKVVINATAATTEGVTITLTATLIYDEKTYEKSVSVNIRANGAIPQVTITLGKHPSPVYFKIDNISPTVSGINKVIVFAGSDADNLTQIYVSTAGNPDGPGYIFYVDSSTNKSYDFYKVQFCKDNTILAEGTFANTDKPA